MILHDWRALPLDRLPDIGFWATQCRARGARTLQDAGRLLQDLPYGRPGEGRDYRDVFREGRGTCSTKHAALAEIAGEARVPLLLTVGIYDMCEANTPGVGAVLAAAALPSIPEAHCYVILDGARIDVTRRRTQADYDIGDFHEEVLVEPADLADYKEPIHREALRVWLRLHPGLAAGRDEDALWDIREACIAALEEE